MPISKGARFDPLHMLQTDHRYPNENVARNRGIVHPARFSHRLYEVMAALLEEEFGSDIFTALDPFAGIGGIHNLAFHIRSIRTIGVEIEEEWATCHPGTEHGDSRNIDKMFAKESFDSIITSPTYGNRMADHHEAKDGSARMTYKHTLGRDLTEGNTGMLFWGEEYRATHALIWRKCATVLRPGGIFLLNIKDHIKGGRVMPVTQFHIDTILALGFKFEEQVYVPLNGYRYGSNFKSRMKYESVIRFRKPISAPYPLTNA